MQYHVLLFRYFVVKWKVKDSVYLWTGIALLIIHLLLEVGLSAFGIVIPIYMIRNFLFMGYPLFCAGMLIRKNEDLILKIITYKSAIILIVIGLIETVISYFISGKNELFVGSVLVAVSLLIISLKAKDIQINEKVIKLAHTSTGIYLIHIITGEILKMMVSTDILLFRNLLPVLVCIISTFVVLFYEKIKKSRVCK